ncbi:hypothetical protein OQA88_12518 [Cercophora sp. LCS_1]
MGQSPSIPLSLPPTFHTTPLPKTYTVALVKSWTSSAAILTDPHSGVSFTADWPQGYHGRLIFYNGPSKEHAPLARAKPAGFAAKDFAITLPAVSPHDPERTEIMRHVSSLWQKDMYWFAFPVGDATERFEWRRSRGEEVKDVRNGAGRGWKLVRMGDIIPAGERGGEHEHNSGGGDYGVSSDGREIVAVWADYGSLSLSKMGTIEFRGSGATEELGNMWRVMVV